MIHVSHLSGLYNETDHWRRLIYHFLFDGFHMIYMLFVDHIYNLLTIYFLCLFKREFRRIFYFSFTHFLYWFRWWRWTNINFFYFGTLFLWVHLNFYLFILLLLLDWIRSFWWIDFNFYLGLEVILLSVISFICVLNVGLLDFLNSLFSAIKTNPFECRFSTIRGSTFLNQT